MGAETFFQRATGKTAKEAFNNAVDSAAYDHGHSGYTGTIAEKNEFVIIDVPDGVDPRVHANQLVNEGDERVNNKWGPAGCIQTGAEEFLFFGWASS